MFLKKAIIITAEYSKESYNGGMPIYRLEGHVQHLGRNAAGAESHAAVGGAEPAFSGAVPG